MPNPYNPLFICRNCLNFQPRPDLNAHGECRKNAPGVDFRNANAATWPVARLDDWCARFDLNPEHDDPRDPLLPITTQEPHP